jgi:hypothetical protein
MNDPRRLLDQALEPEVRRALDADAAYAPPVGAQRAVWRSVMMLIAGGSAATTASAAAAAASKVGGGVASGAGAVAGASGGVAKLAASASLLGVVKAASVGAGIGVAVVGAALYRGESPAEPVSAVASARVDMRAKTPLPTGRALDVSTNQGEAVQPPLATDSVQGEPARASAVATPKPRGGAVASEAVNAESAMILEARAALRGGRVTSALELLERAASLYPRGVLTQEREALHIEALMRSGATERARQSGASFVKRYPGSPHAGRVRELTALDDSATPAPE